MNEFTLNKREGVLNLTYNSFPYTFNLNEEEENSLGETWMSFTDHKGEVREVCLLEDKLTIYPLVKLKQKIGPSSFSYSLETDFNNGEEINNKTIVPA